MSVAINLSEYRQVKNPRVGDLYSGKYPKGGNLNILCNRFGEIVNLGKGPGGPFETVQGFDGGPIRSLSLSKAVERKIYRKR